MESQHFMDIINLMSKLVDKTDKVNQKLVIAIITISIAFSLCFTITVTGIAYFYFTTDYNYGTAQIQNNTTDSTISSNKEGGKN